MHRWILIIQWQKDVISLFRVLQGSTETLSGNVGSYTILQLPAFYKKNFCLKLLKSNNEYSCYS